MLKFMKKAEGDESRQREAEGFRSPLLRPIPPRPTAIAHMQVQHATRPNGRSSIVSPSETEVTSSSASVERRSVTSSLSSSASSSFTSLDDSVGGRLDLRKSSSSSLSSAMRTTSSTNVQTQVPYRRRLSDSGRQTGAVLSLSVRPGEAESDLENEPWFFPNYDRKQAEALLQAFGEEASFLVRYGSNQRGTIGVDSSASANMSPTSPSSSSAAKRSSSLTAECTPFSISILHRGRVHHLQVRKLGDTTGCARYALGKPKTNELTFENMSALIAHQRRVGLILSDESDSMLLGNWPPRPGFGGRL